MPPVIRISDNNWERLKKWDVPLEDSADDALDKALTAAEAGPHQLSSSSRRPNTGPDQSAPDKKRRATRANRLPRKAYEFPALESLYELGGKARAREVLKEVERRIKSILSEDDYLPVDNGRETHWRKEVHWARFNLVNRGLLKRGSRRGIWELSDQGVAEVENRRA